MGEAMIRGRRTRINYAKDWEYTTNDTATLVTKYIGNKTDVVVPSKINGKPVVLKQSTARRNAYISSFDTTGAFINNKNIVSVKFSEGVEIENNNMGFMFWNCSNLKSGPIIPINVTNMINTFQDCVSFINTPTVPSNVTDMASTFYNCFNLVNAPVIPANVTNMGGTFQGCYNIINAPNIPDSVIFLGSAFQGCNNITNAPVIPANVNTIAFAFYGCSKLTGNIHIKSNRINNSGIYQCFGNTSLPKNVYIPATGLDATNNTWNAAFNTTYGINGKNGVTVIDDAALDWTYTTNDTATLLTKYTGTKADVVVPATLAAKPTMLSTAVFEGTNVNSVDLVNTQFVNNDMANTFNGCTNLKSVINLTNTVNAMNHAFNNATNLKTVSKFNATSSIRMSNGYMAFSNCTNLTSVPNIGIIASAAHASTNVAYAFHNCSNLLNVNMPLFGIRVYGTASTFNGYKTFANCCNLTALETMGITIIGNSNLSNMFQNTGISSLGNLSNDRGEDFGFSVIGNANMNGAFVGCKNLSTANFSSAIFDEGDANVNMPFAFYNCQNLVNVINLPNGARNLSYGFANCSKLNEVTRLPETVNDVSYTFSNCTNLKTAVDISDSVYTMQGTYKGCTNLTNVPITSVSLNTQNMYSAFENCYKLTKAPIIPPNVTGMRSVFRNCTNLMGNIVIYTNKLANGGMSNAFNGTSAAKNVYAYNQGFNAMANTWNSAINTTLGINGKNGVTLINMGTWENTCWTYTTSGTNTLVTKYKGTPNEVYVPKMINGRNVVLQNSASTELGVFTDSKNITRVKFDSGVSIANNNMATMFSDCYNLIYVSGIPANVTDMALTFHGCYNLINAPTIPANVTNMGSTFWNCQNLVNVPTISANVTDMSGTFENCYSLVNAPTIPINVTNMSWTFSDCVNLVHASVIPANVVDMSGTFSNCKKLVNAPVIPANVTNMGYTFQNCYNLVNAPDMSNAKNVTKMVSTFRNCVNLTHEIRIGSNRINNTSMQYCFYGTTLPKNVYIPATGLDVTNNTWNAAFNTTYGINGKNGVTVMDEAALDYKYTTNSTSCLITKYIGTKKDVVVPNKINGKPVVLQNSVNSTSGVFTNNQNIVSVKFNEGVSIANNNMGNAFYNCQNLISASGIPANVTDMSYTFAYCYRLVNAPDIPANVTNMGQTFQLCRNLANAPDMSKATNIKAMKWTFSYCYNLVNAPTIPASVDDMYGAFMGCTNLVNAPTIPANVTSLWQTFYNCTNLVNAPIIPANVTSMSATFQNCFNLTGNIYIYTNKLSSYANTFYGTTKAKNVYMYNVGYNTTANSWNAWNNSSTGVNGKNGVTLINLGNWENSMWTYSTSGTNSLVTKYKGSETNVYVPDYINGRNTVVNANCFASSSTIRSARFGSAVKINSGNASKLFYSCPNLIACYNVPDNITSMQQAFMGCYNLKTAPTIPANVENVVSCFDNCYNVTGNIIVKSNRISNAGMQYFFYNAKATKNVYLPTTGYNSTANSWAAANSSSNKINGVNNTTIYDINTYTG